MAKILISISILAILFTVQCKAISNDVRNHNSKGFEVTTVQSKPFLMVKEDGIGNDRYYGFVPDLLSELSRQLPGFTYSIHLVADGAYGSSTSNNTWNGMIGEIMTKKADIAAADLTITVARKQVVDFTEPFLSTGIGIIMKRQKPPPLGSSIFLKPFSTQLWIGIIIAFLATSIIFFLLARFSSAEWNHSENELQNNLSVCNVLYFAWGSLMMQNSKIAPKGMSTRLLSGVWWCFCLVLVCSYIANLTTIIINQIDLQVLEHAIKDIDDLSRQTKVKYGTLAGGSTNAFFKKSQIPLYQYVYSQMTSMTPPPFVPSSEEGIKRVKEEDFAFFMEQLAIAYRVSKDCDLVSVGGPLDYKGYGFALRPTDPYTRTLSMKISEMQETGTIHKLREKWWGKPTCTDGDENKGASLTLYNVKGIFITLIFGIFFAFVLGLAEVMWRAKRAKDEGGDFGNELIREAKFACCGGTNPTRQDKRNGRQDDNIVLERQDAM